MKHLNIPVYGSSQSIEVEISSDICGEIHKKLVGYYKKFGTSCVTGIGLGIKEYLAAWAYLQHHASAMPGISYDKDGKEMLVFQGIPVQCLDKTNGIEIMLRKEYVYEKYNDINGMRKDFIGKLSKGFSDDPNDGH